MLAKKSMNPPQKKPNTAPAPLSPNWLEHKLGRHTHIDIDGRNAIYTNHLYGRKEAGGKVDSVNTPSQFDAEVAKAFRSDNFFIKRLVGILNCKDTWNKWLGYSRFGSARSTSAEAQAQGGRQEEPMCMHFFMGKQPQSIGKALMRF